ncbi:MAG: alpha/beta hydrolase [Actinomycetota bacterium]|nr:alpha/beta hydrolase [Actinomycetota bacterium]
MSDVEQMCVVVDGATVRYRSIGEGPAVVFVHGVYVGGSLWQPVVEQLDGFRCIVPTWPFGAHADPAPDADVSARAAAARIPAFLEALDLHDVTLVGNDTGGGLCLASLATGHPGLQRIGRLVLTNCDSYEHFPPKGFDKLVAVCRRASLVGAGFIRFLASGVGRRFFLKSVCAHPPRGEAADRVFEAFATSKAARKDALRTTQSLEPSVTLDAVDSLKAFTKPVLLAWGADDKLFPLAHAERLQTDFPNATLHPITDAKAFVMLDQPAALAAAIADFAAPTTA